MLSLAARLYLLTGSGGTTPMPEKRIVSQEPAWLQVSGIDSRRRHKGPRRPWAEPAAFAARPFVEYVPQTYPAAAVCRLRNRRSDAVKSKIEDALNTECVYRFTARMLLGAMALLAPGIAADLVVIFARVTHSLSLAGIVAGFSLLGFYGAWFGYTSWARHMRPSDGARAQDHAAVDTVSR